MTDRSFVRGVVFAPGAGNRRKASVANQSDAPYDREFVEIDRQAVPFVSPNVDQNDHRKIDAVELRRMLDDRAQTREWVRSKLEQTAAYQRSEKPRLVKNGRPVVLVQGQYEDLYGLRW